MQTTHKLQKNTKLTYPNGRVVLEAKQMYQKEMRYVWSVSHYWDWDLKSTSHLRQLDS